ncbi:unnamed protein product [Peniophora sp. CBMAI 1063]|nr:unnamed protein product [Peniophora sp. CBMAI 1063]
MLGDRIAANARVDGSLPMLLSLVSWWWNGDLALKDGEALIDPAARASRPSLLDDPATYVAALAICVFQTTLSATTYDLIDARGIDQMISAQDGRKSWTEAENLHQYILRSGIVTRTEEDVDMDLEEADRVAELRDVILDYGRAMLAMAVDLHATNKDFSLKKLRQNLDRDVQYAYGLPLKDWIDSTDVAHRPFIPSVTFVPDYKPDITFQFASS